MSELFCEKKFCIARFSPLVMPYATTVHRFQGFEAQFDKVDTINHIIVDLGNLNWEKKLRRTVFVVASHTKTVGTSTVNNHHKHFHDGAKQNNCPAETRMDQPLKRWQKLVDVSSNGYRLIW